jgi:hypothetical protein
MSKDLNEEPHGIIALNYNESSNMCANMFDVVDDNNNHCVVMSQRAKEHFTKKNWTTLNTYYKVVASEVDIIESIGGGSCRCMLVELF